MAGIGTAEFRERAEEMVVTGIAFGGDEAAHGESVDQTIVKPLVLQDRSGGAQSAPPGRRALARPLPLVEGVRRNVNAELVLDGVLDQRLGEHGAMQMKVQLAALRHALEEFVKARGSPRTLAARSSALLRFAPANTLSRLRVR